MNSGRKCLKVSLSGPAPAVTATTLLQLASHDALLQEKEEEQRHQLVEEDTTDSRLVITMGNAHTCTYTGGFVRTCLSDGLISPSEDSQVEMKAAKRTAARRRKRKLAEQEEPKDGASESEEEAGVEVEIDRQLDQSLETKSKQHNLTTVNVKNIIHEVITNEHVVAMMKAAINETEAVPPFEPKMTRSKLKEVVEKGVVIPTWTISPIKKTSDIPASCLPSYQNSRSRSRLVRARSVSMGPPPPPKAPLPKPVTDRTFLEKLHAVEEELAVCMEPYQPLSESEDETGLMAYRTRSKRPLRDVPLGRLEAELQAPDITPDMYDSSSTHEDREWTDWLRGLMSSDMDNEEECDDEDDPEYNFLADIDEPDVEDYRDDKAVRITSKYANTHLKEDLAGQEVDDEGHEEEEEPQEEAQTFQTHTPEEQQDRCLSSLFQHVQLLTQVYLLTSLVPRLHSEAETCRQFLCELDLLAQRAELIGLLALPGFCSVFRASNLQVALQLLEELRQAPISYQPQLRPLRCFPVMPAELAWLFATRPVFMYPELLPCASLDPALYSVLYFFEKLSALSHLCTYKHTQSGPLSELSPSVCLLQTFRYQRRVLPMPVACRPVNLADWRPPVEREESVMPLWLLVGRLPMFPLFLSAFSCFNSEIELYLERLCNRSCLYFLLPGQVCEAVQMYPGLWEELVCVLDEFSTAAVDVLYDRISSVLQPWPQLLRDFAAFLNRRQARHCGLLLEQQLFERSRVFLWKLRWSLGESSALYQQVVSVLQGSSAPLPEDINKLLIKNGTERDRSLILSLFCQLSSLLCHHPDLQQELRQFYHEFHTTNCATQSSPDRSQGTDREEQEEGQRQAVCAKNITLTATGEKVVMWTREVDRAILTACRERGATWKTFRQVSTHLGNKTAQQVR
uniref:Uncharacterized protein n=1 Tax=Oreochromis aureus TaxID=47969 RepID=A0A668STE8_OREAU